VSRKKSRLTITLSPDLLDRLDRAVDREGLQNRSRAIETYLRRVLRPTVGQAVILAGGAPSGGRMPALDPIAGRPLILHMLRHLVDSGVRSVVVLAGESEPAVRRLVGSGESLGASVRYLPEPELRGTAGALKLAEPLLAGEPFLVLHGDILTDIDLGEFARFHFDEGSLATIAVKPRQSEPRYGQVMLQGNRITRFFETGRDGGISIVNTGVYLFQPGIFGLIDPRDPTQLETDVFPLLAETGELSAFLFQGIWYDISTPANYRRAEQRWSERGA